MKITEISAVKVTIPPPNHTPTPPRRNSWAQDAEVANPMSRFAAVKPNRGLWLPKWDSPWCKVTAEDGTWGLGQTSNGRPVAAVIEDHLAPHLVGQDVMATEKMADMMYRMTKPYGSTGLASYAVSAVDLALWDLKGKLLGESVASLLGGPQQDRMKCYATGNDVDWYRELGFEAFKLACPYGPADGLEGLKKNEEFVANARQIIGDDSDLMLDCWMAFDVEYSVQLAHRLRPYRLTWMEECLVPEDFDSHLALRERLPWQALSTGEHWYTHVPFLWAVAHRAVDIIQPDIGWCGGVSACRRIAAAADAAGISVYLHGGGNSPTGQQFSAATPSVPGLEFFVGSPPGVPLAEGVQLPGQRVPEDGWIEIGNAPGFGLDVSQEWISPYFG